jgi:hypothetical protein
MRRRTRNPDKYNLGRSSLVPFVESEGWQQRHARRKDNALQNKEEVEAWCTKNKWKLNIKNNGHHWIFYTHQNKMIEWFPSSGKLVIGKNWSSGIHCHDYKQLLKTLQQTLR